MSEVRFYKKKPDTIQAIKYNGSNIKDIRKFMGEDKDSFIYVNEDEYVVRFTNGDFEIFSEKAFKESFESVTV
jgi:hypothetical protein